MKTERKIDKPYSKYLDAETNGQVEALCRSFSRGASLKALWSARNPKGSSPASDADADALFKMEMRQFALATSNDFRLRSYVASEPDLTERAKAIAGRLSILDGAQAAALEFAILLAFEGSQIWTLEFENAWIGSSPPEALARELDRRATISGDETLAALNLYLTAIFEDAGYQKWLEVDQFAGATSAKGRFTVPAGLAVAHAGAHRLLAQSGIVAEDRTLEVKVDRHYGRIHLTDGFWASPSLRVFPTTDESERLCEYVKAKGYDRTYQTLIDPACGSGHHAMGLSTISSRVSLDINLRAVAYARANALLAGDVGQDFGVRDIRTGLPTMCRQLSGSLLVAANMPFALLPSSEIDKGKVAQDGGSRGMTLSQALLDALRGLWADSPGLRDLRAIVLFYSLGRSATGPWEIEEETARAVPNADVTTTILTDHTMWRVNGRKMEANPMPVERLHTKAACRFTWPEFEEAGVAEGYHRREQELLTEGWTHLGYGIVDIHLRR